MKKSIWTGMFASVVGIAAATALNAQAPAAQPPDTPSDKNVVVTGCLRPAPSSSDAAATTGAAGTPGAAGTAGAAAGTPGAAATTGNVADQKFLLTDAAAADASAAPSPADPASAGTARVSYRLIANPTALAPHVGKKLELTGTLEDPNASTQDSTAGANATLPALRVASGKIVGESCDSK